jgi:EmrB/QacA subfamily drug resistance transporter
VARRASAPAVARPVDEHGFEERTHREILLVMSGLMVAMLLAMLDNMIVAPALPTIVGDLGGLQHLAWVITAYILGTTVGTPLWGKLGDLYSRKTVFMASIVLFLVGSALCGMAHSMNQLIAFRALQGIGAGGLMVGVMAVLAVLIPPRQRGRYMGYFMAIMPVSMIAGPLIGGWITDHASWRWAFYVNLPLGGLALLVIASTMHLSRPPAKKVYIDWLGAALMVVWTSSLVLVTSWGGTQYAWDSKTILGLIWLTFTAFLLFLVVESRVPEPVLPLGVFRILNFSLVVALSFVVGFAMFGGMTFLPQYQQYVQGASATNSGLLLLPMMLGIIITSLTAGQVSSRTGHYKTFPILGPILMVIGLLLLSTMGVHTSRTVTGLFMFVMGLGMGQLFQITMLVAQNSVPMRDIGAATAASTFLRSMGGSIGVSMLGAVYAHRLADTLHDRLGAANPLGSGAELSPAMVRKMPQPVIDALQSGITHGASAVFMWAGIVAAPGILIGLFVKQVPLRGSKPAAASETTPAIPTGEAAEFAVAVADTPGVAAPAAEATVLAAEGGLAGRVVQAGGLAVPAAVVSVIGTDGRVLARIPAGQDGSFGLPDLPDGSYALAVLAPQFRPAATEVRLPRSGSLEVLLSGRGESAHDTTATPELSPTH